MHFILFTQQAEIRNVVLLPEPYRLYTCWYKVVAGQKHKNFRVT
jgi:hypothetical protein